MIVSVRCMYSSRLCSAYVSAYNLVSPSARQQRIHRMCRKGPRESGQLDDRISGINTIREVNHAPSFVS